MPDLPAVPRLTGIEHIGLTVPDIDAATGFLASVLGAQPLYDIGPFADAREWFARHLARGLRSEIRRMRVLKVANGPVLELIEVAATGTQESAAGSGWHLAFYVEDMDAALAALKHHGVPILSGPVTMTEGPSAGLEWLYFEAPWGQQLELVSYPGGIAAYRELGAEVWRPR